MMGLSDGERISMIRSAVLIQHTRVTDRRTDRQTDGIGVAVAYTRYSIYAVARKNCVTSFVKIGHCFFPLKDHKFRLCSLHTLLAAVLYKYSIYRIKKLYRCMDLCSDVSISVAL